MRMNIILKLINSISGEDWNSARDHLKALRREMSVDEFYNMIKVIK